MVSEGNQRPVRIEHAEIQVAGVQRHDRRACSARQCRLECGGFEPTIRADQ